jgi:hypothetical protein
VRSIRRLSPADVSGRPGDILTLYLYKPELEQRSLQTVKVE